jgi:hypothetical protein
MKVMISENGLNNFAEASRNRAKGPPYSASYHQSVRNPGYPTADQQISFSSKLNTFIAST